MSVTESFAVEQCYEKPKSERKTWTYDVVALSVPIIFNKFGDHDPNGMIYALEHNREERRGVGGTGHRACPSAPRCSGCAR